MKDWIEIIQGTEKACDEFLNRNTFPEDRKLYKWVNGVLYKKIVENNKIDKNKNNLELYKLF